MVWKNRIVGTGTTDPKDLDPNELNWRKHPPRQSKALEGNLDTLGWISDIIVNQRTGRMIDGHLRVELALKNKEKEVPVKYVDLSPEEEEQAILTLDPISAMAEADKTLLTALLSTVQSDDERIKELMNDISQEYKIKKPVQEDDYEPPAEIETNIVRGDIFQLGRHRVMCGDSISREDVNTLMDGKKADMVFTDPPYGINAVKGGKVGPGGQLGFGKGHGSAKNAIVRPTEYAQIVGDKTTDTARDFYKTCKEIGFENYIIFGGNYFTDFLIPSRCWIVWDKQNAGNFADVELAWTSFDKPAKLYSYLWNGLAREGDRKLEGKKRIHPTQKPVGLLISIHNDFPFSICYDGFLGSGTTLIACEQLDRICYGMEISPQYCEIICQRWEKLTGKKREKLSGVNT